MNHRPALPALLVASALALLPSVARAEAITETDAITQALARNPTYAVSAAQLAQAVASLHSAEARLDPTLTLDAGATRSRNPSMAASGVLTSTSLLYSANATLKKKLIGGTEFTFALGTTWQQAQTPFANSGAGTTVTTPNILTTGPAYGLTARLSVVQPLLRGAGRDVGLAAEREARGSRDAQAAARDRGASELVRDLLGAYWELWYASSAVTIQQTARDTAKRQRDEAAARRDTGSLAPADVYTFDTELSQAEESLAQARNDERTRALELSRLLGRRTAEELRAATEPPAPEGIEGDLSSEVLAASPEMAERRAELDLAVIRARTAEDSYRSRLDLDAYAQAQGLGNKDAGAAVGQFAGLDAVSVHIGLTYELPLRDRRRDAEGERAQQAIVAARHNLEATSQRLLASTETQRDKAATARRRIELAETTATVARASASAEQERFRTGSSTALAVVRAQDQARSAELRLARARVDLASAHLSLLHLTGRLMARASGEKRG